MCSENDLESYDELSHHGILGQKWGVRNGPPYPLDASDHSSSEKKAGWRKSLEGGSKDGGQTNYGSSKERKKKELTPEERERRKKIVRNVAIGVGVTAAVALGAYCVYKYGKSSFKLTDDALNGLNLDDTVAKLHKSTMSSKNKLFDKKLWNYFSEGQHQTVEDYTSLWYKPINRTLYGEKLSSIHKRFRDEVPFKTFQLTEMIDKSVTKQDIVTYRKTPEEFVYKMLGENVTAQDLLNDKNSFIGKTFLNKGFYSSTIDIDSLSKTFEGVKLTTICPKGTKGMYIAPVSRNPGENEFLIQRSTVFEILDIKSEADKISEIVVKVASQLSMD